MGRAQALSTFMFNNCGRNQAQGKDGNQRKMGGKKVKRRPQVSDDWFLWKTKSTDCHYLKFPCEQDRGKDMEREISHFQ